MVVELDHILLIGRAGEGKSTYATKMSPEFAILDFDRRWPEMRDVSGVSHIYNGAVLEVVKRVEADRKAGKLSKVGTIVVDSGSSVLDPMQSLGRLQVSAGEVKNANDVHRIKADTMRALRGVMQPFNASSLWIFHIEDSGMSGKVSQRTTISKMEVERMKHNLNIILVMGSDAKGRFVRIEWTRFSPDAIGHMVRDTHKWEGVPQMVHEFVREYRSEMGYNGSAYSPEWLLEFLKKKGQAFESIEQMAEHFKVAAWPEWYNRNAWAEFVK